MPDKTCGTCRFCYKDIACYSTNVGELQLKRMGYGGAAPIGFTTSLRIAWIICHGRWWGNRDDAEYFRQPLDGGDDEPDNKPVCDIRELLK